jgi:hypothetical protein
MAKETTIARESSVSPLNALRSDKARASGHTASDYLDLYRQQKAGVMQMYARGELSTAEYSSRMNVLNRKIGQLERR